MKKKLRADFHIHSSYSFDGVLPPKQIVNYAINQNAKWIAITDHNNLEGVRDLWDSCAKDVSKNFGIKYYKKDLYNCPYIGYKGVNIVSGLEATCRISAVENKKGNSSKVHLLVYGADINKNSPISKLMEIKHENDVLYDFGTLEYLLSQVPGHNITQKHIKEYIQEMKKKDSGYSTLSKNDIYNFLWSNGITIARSQRHLNELLKNAPVVERVNIEAKHLIDIAHASGGIVVMAHPAVNLVRTNYPEKLVSYLVDNGIDGFECLYNGSNEKYDKMIRKICGRKKKTKDMLFTAGSDTHSFYFGNTIGTYCHQKEDISINKQTNFIAEISKLGKARENGYLSSRKPHILSSVELDELIKYYRQEAKDAIISEGTPLADEHEIMQPLVRHVSKKKQKKEAKKEKHKKQKEKKEKRSHYYDRSEEEITPAEKALYEKYIREMEEMYGLNPDDEVEEFETDN